MLHISSLLVTEYCCGKGLVSTVDPVTLLSHSVNILLPQYSGELKCLHAVTTIVTCYFTGTLVVELVKQHCIKWEKIAATDSSKFKLAQTTL